MIKTPDIFFLVKGSAEGKSELNVFDTCLLNAGIGNTNLVKMSSIVPPRCKKIEKIDIPAGVLLPIAYSFIYSDEPGKVISAAVAVALPDDDNLPGLIMEHSAEKPLDDVKKVAKSMAEEGFKVRGYKLKDIIVDGIEHTVKKRGGAFAAVALWYRD